MSLYDPYRTGGYYRVHRPIPIRLILWALGALFAFAAITNLVGSGYGTPDAATGRWAGRCIHLAGDGWVHTPCVDAQGMPTPGALPAQDLGPVGEFGAEAAGPVLTPQQVRDLWIRHGGDPAQADIAVAVATAESGRRPGAVNRSNTNGTIDRGLYQMNSIHGDCSTFDVNANVACAVRLQQSGGWRHWVAYQKGAHAKYLGLAA